jgi:hypothetical protein
MPLINLRNTSDDWIYYELVTHALLITVTSKQYSTIVHLHQLQFAVPNALGFPLFPLVVSEQRLSTHYNSFTLRLLHISVLFTEALFTIHAENSSRL